jgi:hypothetical protein
MVCVSVVPVDRSIFRMGCMVAIITAWNWIKKLREMEIPEFLDFW